MKNIKKRKNVLLSDDVWDRLYEEAFKQHLSASRIVEHHLRRGFKLPKRKAVNE